MIDRYLPELSNEKALIWVSNMVQKEQVWTFQEVYENICRMSIILKRHKV